ncbi:single-stranded DNA-binding protein [Auritidibacter ignavus]|uniref:single-stranded DNA-binding protein n=1 Tax=Auritidibacter ignavus TaxID=678932 RepID=UPI00109CEDDF|nr:single-stranded DNA-binding protein [Auritidibacter ignavus]
MRQNMTVRGTVGTEPRKVTLPSGDSAVDFRLASTERKWNQRTGEWEDGNTNWFTVTAYKKLADNVYRSVVKGQPVVVTGNLSIRPWTSKDGQRQGTAVEIYATTIGHDLAMGFAEFSRPYEIFAGSTESWDASPLGRDPVETPQGDGDDPEVAA